MAQSFSTLEIFVIGPLATLRRLSLVSVLTLRTVIYGTTFILAGIAATLFVGAVAPSFVFLPNRMVMQPSLPFSLGVALPSTSSSYWPRFSGRRSSSHCSPDATGGRDRSNGS
jgi:hypothetical protein